MSTHTASDRQIRSSHPQKIMIVILLALAVLLPRIFDLDAFMTADEKRWIAGTAGFTRKLALLQWDKLLQWPHPGITVHWLGSLTIHENQSLALQKLPLVLGQSILIGLAGYIFYRLWGARPAILFTLLLALNPFLVAHTRVYAPDSLLALFLLLSVSFLLLWHKTDAIRYLIFAAATGALGVLSKLPGIIIVPFTIFLLSWWGWRQNKQQAFSRGAIWLVAFGAALILFFPSLLLNFSEVAHLTKEFLLEGDAQDVHGPTNQTYYLKALFFFSTPLHLAALAALPFMWRKTKNKEQILILLLFAVLFVIEMSFGAKKGDRYILPSFLFLDAAAVLIFFSITSWLSNNSRRLLLTAYCLLITLIVWQAYDIARLHPYTLAYVNPIAKPFYDSRRLGWGEGLDLAASYLNEKPNAAQLKVASIYPAEFAYRFAGETIPLNHYEGSGADYVVLYRSMLERGEDSWEADVLNHFAARTPEHVVLIGGLEYAWVYKY
jgi:4-amino-4-deoxy-L-arabinose transferase-like glycosyltransferase